MSVRVVGTCSLCHGPVVVDTVQLKAGAPLPPRCESCGATPRTPYGPVIDMQPKAGGIGNAWGQQRALMGLQMQEQARVNEQIREWWWLQHVTFAPHPSTTSTTTISPTENGEIATSGPRNSYPSAPEGA